MVIRNSEAINFEKGISRMKERDRSGETAQVTPALAYTKTMIRGGLFSLISLVSRELLVQFFFFFYAHKHTREKGTAWPRIEWMKDAV